MLVCFTTWLSLCVFVAQYLQDTRAYGAMLSGYTVAIIAISNIDTPQNVFDAAVGVSRRLPSPSWRSPSSTMPSPRRARGAASFRRSPPRSDP
jgi:hypothetical protein